MDPSRSSSVGVVVNRSTIETKGERQTRFQFFETKHEMSIEAILKDLEAAQGALLKERSPNRELDLEIIQPWKHDYEDEFKERFFDRMSCLSISVSL